MKPFIVREGETVVLSTHIVGNPIPTLDWFRNDKPIKNIIPKRDEGVTSITIAQAKPSDAGIYSVEAKNEIGTAETRASLTVESNKLFSIKKNIFRL